MPLPVAAPVEVVVNGSAVEALSARSYPSSTDGYQIDVQLVASVPAGTAEIKVRSAWIEGSPVLIPTE
jgi:hypothetical protein